MSDRRPPDLEMTIDGEFVSPPKPPLLTRVMIWAIAVAVLAASVFIAALALWFALIALPIAMAAGAVAYGIWRYRVWQAGKIASGP